MDIAAKLFVELVETVDTLTRRIAEMEQDIETADWAIEDLQLRLYEQSLLIKKLDPNKK